MDTKLLKSAVIIPSTTEGFYWSLYEAALKATRSCNALLTVNIERVEALIKKGPLNKVIIIMGSKKLPSTSAVYEKLKKLDPKIKFILMDSWTCPVRKKDKMILLPVKDPSNLIKECLKD